MILNHVYKIENLSYNDMSQTVVHNIRVEYRNLNAKYSRYVPLPPSWQWTYMVEKSPDGYNGSFIKRFKKLFYKNGIVLTNEDLLPITKILDTNRETVYSIKFTKDSWNAGDFGDHGSCFWGCRDMAPQIIKDAGGVACQLLPNIGRCWMLPFRQGYLIFNAYGKTLGQFADLICSVLSLKSHIPNVEIIWEEPLYINNSSTRYLTKNGNYLIKDIDLSYISQDAIRNGTIKWCIICEKYHSGFGVCDVITEEY